MFRRPFLVYEEISMKPMQRPFLRLAQAIHRAGATASKPAHLALPAERWRECQTILRRRSLAQEKGWTAAAEQMRIRLDRATEELREALAGFHKVLHASPATPFASVPEILADLIAIDEEFAEFAWSGKDRTLTATTLPITLEGVRLGRFAIELRWENLRPPRRGCYRVMARDPHPSGLDEDVMHPHVQGEWLCEGDAQPAIQQALSQGRLLDFFVIVRSVLETYNDSSPYVSLADWDDVRCGDCDASVAADDVSDCCGCNVRLCEECRSSCSACSDGYCSGCLCRCAVCDDDYCSSCLESCVACNARTCSSCLHSDLRCETCHDKAQEDDDRENSEANEANPAVQPHRLGQAAVPA